MVQSDKQYCIRKYTHQMSANISIRVQFIRITKEAANRKAPKSGSVASSSFPEIRHIIANNYTASNLRKGKAGNLQSLEKAYFDTPNLV